LFASIGLFGFSHAVTLHFRIFAEVMFLAGNGEEQSNAYRTQTGAEQNGSHPARMCRECFPGATKTNW